MMDFDFMRSWCEHILTTINARYPQRTISNSLFELNNIYMLRSEKKMHKFYNEIYAAGVGDLSIDDRLNKNLLDRFGKILQDVPPVVINRKRLNDEECNDLQFKKDWVETILDFIASAENNSAATLLCNDMKNVLLSTYTRKDLRGMKFVYNDINEMAKGLKKNQLSELNKILITKFARSLTDEDKKNDSGIEKIINQGKINSEEEYRLVLAKVNDIYASKSKKQTIKILNDLLLEYDKNKAFN